MATVAQMTAYLHIVQVYLVENGEPNLYDPRIEWVFETEEEAIECEREYNRTAFLHKAVYIGRVDDATGELIERTN